MKLTINHTIRVHKARRSSIAAVGVRRLVKVCTWKERGGIIPLQDVISGDLLKESYVVSYSWCKAVVEGGCQPVGVNGIRILALSPLIQI